MNIKEHPQHVILPKSTGLQHSLSTLYPEVHDLLDITIGYSGLTAKDIPYYTYLVDTVFFRGIYPRQVHLHFRNFPTDSIPGVREAGPSNQLTSEEKDRFNVWLRERFMEKDELMDGFFKTGQFASSSPVSKDEKTTTKSQFPQKIVKLEADVQDYLVIGLTFYFGYFVLFPVYWDMLLFFPRLFIYGF
jgi:hypothetical protein